MQNHQYGQAKSCYRVSRHAEAKSGLHMLVLSRCLTIFLPTTLRLLSIFCNMSSFKVKTRLSDFQNIHLKWLGHKWLTCRSGFQNWSISHCSRSNEIYGFAIYYRRNVYVIMELQTGVRAHRLERTQGVKPVYVSKKAPTLQLRMWCNSRFIYSLFSSFNFFLFYKNKQNRISKCKGWIRWSAMPMFRISWCVLEWEGLRNRFLPLVFRAVK